MRSKRISIAFCIIVFLLIIHNTHAEADISISDYYKFKSKDPQTIMIYITGVGVAYSWANARLTNEGHKPFYCQPGKLALSGENYTDILETEIKSISRKANKPEIPVELILLFGLTSTFPCK